MSILTNTMRQFHRKHYSTALRKLTASAIVAYCQLSASASALNFTHNDINRFSILCTCDIAKSVSKLMKSSVCWSLTGCHSIGVVSVVEGVGFLKNHLLWIKITIDSRKTYCTYDCSPRGGKVYPHLDHSFHQIKIFGALLQWISCVLFQKIHSE